MSIPDTLVLPNLEERAWVKNLGFGKVQVGFRLKDEGDAFETGPEVVVFNVPARTARTFAQQLAAAALEAEE